MNGIDLFVDRCICGSMHPASCRVRVILMDRRAGTDPHTHLHHFPTPAGPSLPGAPSACSAAQLPTLPPEAQITCEVTQAPHASSRPPNAQPQPDVHPTNINHTHSRTGLRRPPPGRRRRRRPASADAAGRPRPRAVRHLRAPRRPQPALPHAQAGPRAARGRRQRRRAGASGRGGGGGGGGGRRAAGAAGPAGPPRCVLGVRGLFVRLVGWDAVTTPAGLLTPPPIHPIGPLQSTSCAGAGSSRRTPPGCCSTTAGRTCATCRAGSRNGTMASTPPSRSTDLGLARPLSHTGVEASSAKKGIGGASLVEAWCVWAGGLGRRVRPNK